jgi:hypothetical protein
VTLVKTLSATGRCDQVQGAESVEGAGQGDAGHAVERRAVPGDLRLVDAEVRRDGAVQALLCEDLVRGLGGGHVCGGGVSVGEESPGQRLEAMCLSRGRCLCLPALCGEGGAHGDRSGSREPAGRCLGGHCEVVLVGVARIVLEGCNGALTPPQGLLCDSLCQHGDCESGASGSTGTTAALEGRCRRYTGFGCLLGVVD